MLLSIRYSSTRVILCFSLFCQIDSQVFRGTHKIDDANYFSSLNCLIRVVPRIFFVFICFSIFVTSGQLLFIQVLFKYQVPVFSDNTVTKGTEEMPAERNKENKAILKFNYVMSRLMLELSIMIFHMACKGSNFCCKYSSRYLQYGQKYNL